MPPLFDACQTLQDESDYDALTHSLPRQPSGRSAVAASGIDRTIAATSADTSLPPVSEQQRHGEQLNQEPLNREGFGVRWGGCNGAFARSDRARQIGRLGASKAFSVPKLL